MQSVQRTKSNKLPIRREVTVYYLETVTPDALRPKKAPPAVHVCRVEIPSPELNHFFYTWVGGAWLWYERLAWSRARWLACLQQPGYETWVAYERGTPAGYFELERWQDGSINIAYFGLLPSFMGRGIGGYLLTCAIERSWAAGATRVCVNTCTLDHPSALANYTARGMRLYREETSLRTITRRFEAPWGTA